MDIYDFIIVGGGSAGRLLASFLSKQLSSKRILILEAGEHAQNDAKSFCPGLSTSLQGEPVYDWQYFSLLEDGLGHRKIKHPRGKLVGGTGAISSHSIVYPDCERQDRITEKLLRGREQKKEWNATVMRDSYERWATEGSWGTMNASRFHSQKSWILCKTTWLEAFKELGHPHDTSCFANSAVHAVTITNAIDASKGERSHAGKAFLEPALKRRNVCLQTGVKVDKILFDKDKAVSSAAQEKLRATAVCYFQAGEQHVIPDREIVLSAGAFESPAVLKRSGIDHKSILQAAKIPILYNLIGVGENLQDHINCSLSVEVQVAVSTRDEAIRDPETRKAALIEWERNQIRRMSEGAALHSHL